MSFILNALRKSEQERQALQSEAVTDKILMAQPSQTRSKTTKLLVFLFFVNVLAIAGIIGLVKNSLISASDATAPALPAQRAVQQGVITEPKAVQPEKSEQAAEQEINSIAEWIDQDKQEPVPKPLPEKPVITKERIAEVIEQPVIAPHARPQRQDSHAVEIQAGEPETVAAAPNTPFLNDLPVEFRQTVPKFTVNVFAYSEDPDRRFVMIDMVKYKPGQHIKDAMLLKEIRRDSLVVDYQNREFRIKRP